MEIYRFALLGIGLGGLYALLGTGVVLIYRGSGVINFAHGAVGMAGTFVFWELHVNHGWPFAAAFIGGLLASGLIGAIVQTAIMLPLQNASELAKIMRPSGSWSSSNLSASCDTRIRSSPSPPACRRNR